MRLQLRRRSVPHGGPFLGPHGGALVWVVRDLLDGLDASGGVAVPPTDEVRQGISSGHLEYLLLHVQQPPPLVFVTGLLEAAHPLVAVLLSCAAEEVLPVRVVREGDGECEGAVDARLVLNLAALDHQDPDGLSLIDASVLVEPEVKEQVSLELEPSFLEHLSEGQVAVV